jgi:uncharacterized protein
MFGGASWWAVVLIGVGVGFLGGLLGKGGSALATPLLHAAGVPPLIALASPLPATIPSTLAASLAYWRERWLDRTVVAWSIGVGLPATVAGALATRWIDGGVLLDTTDVLLAALGVRLVVAAGSAKERDGDLAVQHSVVRLVGVAAVVGLISGLLANSGGFLLVPLYLAVLRLPIKSAFASSLACAAVLAVPGSIVHAALGHVDWRLVGLFGLASIPFANLGARVALRLPAGRLERLYGALLTLLGGTFLLLR